MAPIRRSYGEIPRFRLLKTWVIAVPFHDWTRAATERKVCPPAGEAGSSAKRIGQETRK
jgi:hypothetical protein